MPISARYPAVELLGAIVVLLTFDAFFIAHTHVGLGVNIPGLTWQLSEDWPIFLAHAILFTALLAMSAIDIENYWVDVRFTTIATLGGFLLHALWTPDRRVDWYRPSEELGAAAIVTTVVLLVTVFILRLIFKDSLEENDNLEENALLRNEPKSEGDETPELFLRNEPNSDETLPNDCNQCSYNDTETQPTAAAEEPHARR